MSEQFEFFDVPSPCIRVCQTDERGLCLGCFRNRNERFDWFNLNNNQKREVLRLTRQRYIRFARAKRKLQEETLSQGNENTVQLTLFDDEPNL